jgi:hypothetical protein
MAFEKLQQRTKHIRINESCHLEVAMNKTIVMNEINEILDAYCDGCFLKKQLSKEKGKARAHRFCITTCTIGEQLQFLGQEMNKN